MLLCCIDGVYKVILMASHVLRLLTVQTRPNRPGGFRGRIRYDVAASRTRRETDQPQSILHALWKDLDAAFASASSGPLFVRQVTLQR